MSTYIKNWLINYCISLGMIFAATTFFVILNHKIIEVEALFTAVPSLVDYLLRYLFYLAGFVAFQITPKTYERSEGTE